MFSRNEKIILTVLFAILIVLLAILFTHESTKILLQPYKGDVSVDELIHNVDDVSKSKYYEKLNKIPPEILQSFIGGNWTFSIDSKKLEELGCEDGSIWFGSTNYTAKEICVRTPISVLHEFGHYLDYTLDFPNIHDEYYNLEAKTASIFLGEYATTNSREYFASYFAFWIENANNESKMQQLQLASPVTYQYFLELQDNNWSRNIRDILFDLFD